jgi:hypothetical protein
VNGQSWRRTSIRKRGFNDANFGTALPVILASTVIHRVAVIAPREWPL